MHSKRVLRVWHVASQDNQHRRMWSPQHTCNFLCPLGCVSCDCGLQERELILQPYSPTFGRTETRTSYQRTSKEQELYRCRPTYPRRRRRHLCRPANALSQCGVGQGSQVPSVRIGLLIIVCMITGAEPRPFLLTLAPHGACRCHPALHSAYVLTVKGS